MGARLTTRKPLEEENSSAATERSVAPTAFSAEGRRLKSGNESGEDRRGGLSNPHVSSLKVLEEKQGYTFK